MSIERKLLAASLALVALIRPASATDHTLDVTSERFELVAKNDPLAPGTPARLDLYLADFETNAPLSGASLRLSIRAKETGQEIWGGVAEADAAPGIYRATFTPREAGLYNVIVAIDAAGVRDEFVLSGLEVGAVAAPVGVAGKRPLWPWLIGGGILLPLLVAVIRRRLRAARATGAGRCALVILSSLGLLVAVPGGAHEGHDEGPATSSGAPVGAGAQVFLPKESQFLLGVRTMKASLEAVHERRAVLGRVAPRPGGELDIVAPQSGRVLFPGGRVPVLGERIGHREAVATLVIVDSLSIRAPIAGVITGVFATHGQLLEAGQKIMSVLDPSILWVHADIYEQDLALVERATRAVISSQAYPDRLLVGRQVTLGATLGEIPGTVEAWFEVPNPGGRLRVGMLVDVDIEIGASTPALVVPKSALVDKDGRKLLFVHVAPERFMAREVVVTANLGDRAAVEGDLKPGERVVVAGSYQLLSSPVVSLAR